jgi:branched-chain amino acid transport system ATP-binding protein
MALLEVRDLRVSYENPVLLGVSFDVEEGETAVLFGLNGAGKTTTVSTIAGLLRPDGGTITLGGESIGGRSPSRLVPAGVALVPEGRRVFPDLSVANNLRLGAWARRAHRAEIEERRELVFEYFPRLAERIDQTAGTLSGGEQQMLAIGRALMSRPRLLLIDEASLGLSPALAKTVFQVVSRINDDGVTVIIVEQNVGVLPYADRVLIMEKGTLVFSGVGDEIQAADLRESYLGKQVEGAEPATARAAEQPVRQHEEERG